MVTQGLVFHGCLIQGTLGHPSSNLFVDIYNGGDVSSLSLVSDGVINAFKSGQIRKPIPDLCAYISGTNFGCQTENKLASTAHVCVCLCISVRRDFEREMAAALLCLQVPQAALPWPAPRKAHGKGMLVLSTQEDGAQRAGSHRYRSVVILLSKLVLTS